MESKNEEWNAFLTAEVLVFRLLGRLLYQPPEAAWLQLLAEEDIFAETPLGMGTPEIEAGLALMQGWALAYLADSNGELQSALEGDYNRLFVGPAKVLAPPWESVYLTKERLIFQEQTLQVRGWFRRFGLEVENLYHEPDDHIGLELLFLAHLAELSVAALEEGEQTEFADLL
ncbi:MAG TPA: molecular chaperone TorD family protein, partial [Anaerolineales bacterium]|nr:molecular chaperone TorD family protein [Anaerolineales bacterium]